MWTTEQEIDAIECSARFRAATRIRLGYAPRYIVSGCGSVTVVDTTTGHALMNVSEQFRSSAELHCKWLNGLIEPHWDGDTLVFLPT